MVQVAKRLTESPSRSASVSAMTSPPLDVPPDSISATLADTPSKRSSLSGITPVKARVTKVHPLDTALASPRDSPSSEISEEESSPQQASVRGRIHKRPRSPSPSDELVEDEENVSVPEAEDDEQSFSISSLPDPRSRREQRDISRRLLPANISINANYFTLSKDKITPADATKYLNQSNIPGFVDTILGNSTLILPKAQYNIHIRVMSRKDDWNQLFPNPSCS